MTSVAIASGTQLAAEAGAAIARAGGNAVDAAVAATFVTWVCEPGLTSPGSGGFAVVWPQGNCDPVAIDGFVEMPGRSAPPDRRGCGRRVSIAYGTGFETIVGPGSIGTPGALAAVELMWKRWGTLPWRELIEPAIHMARGGFPMPATASTFFALAHDSLFIETPDAHRLTVHEDGRLRQAGEMLSAQELADSLEEIARAGAVALYQGDLGHMISDWISARGGLLGRDDLQAYRPEVRSCLCSRDGAWSLATTPLPSVGGAALVALADLMKLNRAAGWTAPIVAEWIDAMRDVFSDRLRLLADSGDEARASDASMRARALASPSTSHTSTVDADGLACSITTSTGYSSGVIVPGTGILLNNILGELELCPAGYHALKPGQRARSNMAPSIARAGDGRVLSFGAAGADRIPSALGQVWLNIAALELDLDEAVSHPRCHLELREGEPLVSHEPGVDVSRVTLPIRAFDGAHMFFGGVQAAALSAVGRLVAVGDPRRSAGAIVT